MRRDQFAPYRIQHSTRGPDCKNLRNAGGKLQFLKTWKSASSFSRRCSTESRFFRIFAQLEEESCRTQNTKHVRRRSRINPAVELKRTAQYGEKKVWQFCKFRRSRAAADAGQNSSNPGQIGRHEFEGIIKTRPGHVQD